MTAALDGANLTVSDLTTGYGSAIILRHVDLSIAPGEILALLGRNGAGKTTLLRCLSGLLPAIEGQIGLDGRDISSWSPRQRVIHGLAHVPQGRGIIPGLSVRENLQVGAYVVRGRRQSEANLERVLESFQPLKDWLNKQGQNLSGGQQQLLAIARALMSPARAILLDEPLTGLAPTVVDGVLETIGQLRRQGRAVLLVEQNAHLALEIADRFCVLDGGTVTLTEKHASEDRIGQIEQSYLGLTASKEMVHPTAQGGDSRDTTEQ